MSRIAHLVIGEDGETVWMAGGPHGVITLHVAGGRPYSIVAHSPRPLPGRDSTPSCIRLEGLPCWYLRGLEGPELAAELEACRVADEQSIWQVLDDSYRLYLERQR